MTAQKTSLQAVRLSAAQHQFKALTNQALAIEKLHTEHNQGIDLGVDPEVINILTQSQRMIRHLGMIIKLSEKQDVAAVATLLAEIVGTAEYLCQHAGHFRKFGGEKASDHLKELLGDCNTQKDTSQLRANHSCFKAESSQYQTFEMQVLALANLAQEIAYLAAARAGVEPVATARPTA